MIHSKEVLKARLEKLLSEPHYRAVRQIPFSDRNYIQHDLQMEFDYAMQSLAMEFDRTGSVEYILENGSDQSQTLYTIEDLSHRTLDELTFIINKIENK